MMTPITPENILSAFKKYSYEYEVVKEQPDKLEVLIKKIRSYVTRKRIRHMDDSIISETKVFISKVDPNYLKTFKKSCKKVIYSKGLKETKISILNFFKTDPFLAKDLMRDGSVPRENLREEFSKEENKFETLMLLTSSKNSDFDVQKYLGVELIAKALFNYLLEIDDLEKLFAVYEENLKNAHLEFPELLNAFVSSKQKFEHCVSEHKKALEEQHQKALCEVADSIFEGQSSSDFLNRFNDFLESGNISSFEDQLAKKKLEEKFLSDKLLILRELHIHLNILRAAALRPKLPFILAYELPSPKVPKLPQVFSFPIFNGNILDSNRY